MIDETFCRLKRAWSAGILRTLGNCWPQEFTWILYFLFSEAGLCCTEVGPRLCPWDGVTCLSLCFGLSSGNSGVLQLSQIDP